MGNTCTNCSQCKGDNGENSEVLTVDNKVSKLLLFQSSIYSRYSILFHKYLISLTNFSYSMGANYLMKKW